MKKLNILIVIDNIFPSFGGMGKSTERFSKLLKKKGHNVFVITSHDKREDSVYSTGGIKVYRLNGFNIPFSNKMYTVPYPNKNKISQIIKKEKVDIILLVSYTFISRTISRISKELKIPLVYASHIQPENITSSIHFDNFITRKITSYLIKLACQRADEIITPSNFSKNLLLDYGVTKQINVISNGVDLKKFNSKNVSSFLFRNKFGLQNKRYFLYVGRLMPDKNVSNLIDATSLINWKNKRNKDISLVIVGVGKDMEDLMDKVKSYDLEDRIIFCGKLDFKYLLSAYKSSSVLVHPSLIELEGMVVLEAMAFGKPLLISNSSKSASGFFVKKGYNGYVFDPFNSKALSKKMVSLINDKNKMDIMGKNSLKIVKNYDIIKSVDKLESIFLRLIKSKK